MKTKFTIYLAVLMLLLSNCTFNKEISTYNNLADELSGGKIQIVACDTSVYYVDVFTYSDSSISIIGSKNKLGIESEYHGELLFKNISYIQTMKTSYLSTIAYAGLNIFLIGNGISFLSETTRLEPIVKIVHPSGGDGSCPYIYSWNGNDYILDGEAFGTSLGKALETETCIVLNNLEPDENHLKIKLSNERPETHFFNNIKLTAIETNKNQTVYSNNHNSLSVANNKKKIFKAIDRNNNEITNYLLNDDDNYWQSDLSSASAKFDFEDQIIVELNEVKSVDTLSLMISAINTEISNVVFGYLQTILGDDFVNFIKSAETDPDIIKILKNTLVRSSLKIDIWNGETWNYIDLIYPEANSIKFQKLVRLPVVKNKDNIMKLRLRCLCDVWEIDALNYDDTPNTKFIKLQPKLTSYKSDVQNDYSFLEHKDDLYTKLLPGQSIYLEYKNVEASIGKKIIYAITIGGYLYEWVIDKSLTLNDNHKYFDTNTPKVKLVKEVLKNIDSILPLIYNNWRVVRNKMVLNKM